MKRPKVQSLSRRAGRRSWVKPRLRLALWLFWLPLLVTHGSAASAPAGKGWGGSLPERAQVPLAQGEPEVRRPGDEATAGESVPSAAEQGARKLPRTMTICRGPHGCWSEVSEHKCFEQGATVYRTLPVDESEALPAALKECQEGFR